MDAEDEKRPDVQTAEIELSASDWKLRATVSVPTGPMAIEELLPLARTFADAVSDATIKSVEASGRRITCKKGCGACCRQLVPISGIEARHLRHLVEALAEPRRSEIRKRFAQARDKLEKSGLLDKLRHREKWTDDEVQALGLNYFFQGIACPFLEQESCSIYADRPVACREYLVTSPADNCALPSAETIEQFEVPFKVWPALARFERSASDRFIPWVPLILALDAAETEHADAQERPGLELLSELIENISKNRRGPTQEAHASLAQTASDPSPPNKEGSQGIWRTEHTVAHASIGASDASSQVASSAQDFPLRLGSVEDFARLKSMFQAAHFDEPTICRLFHIEKMSDVDAAKRQKLDLSGRLGLLIRLFLFLESIPHAEVEHGLDSEALQCIHSLDLIRTGKFNSAGYEVGELYYSPVWLYPVAGFVIASDRRINPDGSEFTEIPDIVFPAIFAGTLRFLRVLSKSSAKDALDLCSGSGIAGLVLSKSVDRVVACDITARAAHFARFNRMLNGCLNLEVAQGDLYSAVSGQRFDRIVAHPPYVPSESVALIYRDSGDTGEALIRRIIEGLPEYLRPGGSFHTVCEGWDAREGQFEERVRSWLGHHHEEFDIIFALEHQKSLEEVANQVLKLDHSSEETKNINWRDRFLSAGLERRVYGALSIHRRKEGKKYDNFRPFTRRPRLGDSTDGACFEWALRWYAWRGRKEESGELERIICRLNPCLSPYLQAKVTHAVREGSLVPTEVVLNLDRPFVAATRIDLWMMQMIANFNGQRTVEEVYESARGHLPVPESFGLQDFATLVANLAERGYLQLDAHVFET